MDHRDLRVVVLALLFWLPFAWPARAEETAPPKLLGRCTVADLRQPPYAEWLEAGYAAYTPDPEVLAALRKTGWDGVELTLVFGTWCSDSRREVPRMLKLLDTLGFPPSRLRMIAVDNTEALHKRSPGGEEAGLEIYRVPTLVVSRGGREVAWRRHERREDRRAAQPAGGRGGQWGREPASAASRASSPTGLTR